MFYAHHPVSVTSGSGATGNMICHTTVQRLGCQVTPCSQSVHQADGSSSLHVVGETSFPFASKGHTFTFEAIVVKNLDVDILTGTPFMESSDIAVHPAKRRVILGDGTIHNYGSQQPVMINSAACRAIVLRSPLMSTTIWPGEFLFELPSNAPPDLVYALKPQADATSIRKLTASQLWPQPTMVSSIACKICIPNLTPELHFLPQCACHQLLELQQKFEKLEALGVFKRPKDINIPVEYLNPSFLIKKPSGGYCLVTAFADVGRYSKPQSSLMPDVDSMLHLIALWKHIIATDSTSTFCQIRLSHDSMKYCRVATPFRGVQVYVRSAMGLGMALEELMSQVLGDLLKEGITDDLYCGRNSQGELLSNWKKVLQALHKCDLHLFASKTIINPQVHNHTRLGLELWHFK